MDAADILHSRLDAITKAGCHRSLSTTPGANGKAVLPDGTVWLNFSSNDYRNLSVAPEVLDAARAAVGRGAGSTASRLMSGDLDLHESLEAELADWCGFDAALLFGSGFLANAGVVSALCQSGEDIIYADKLVHASLIDGMRLSGATFRRFRHNDPEHLRRLLEHDDAASGHVKLVIVESVYSMDGDLSPVDTVARLAHEHGAMLLVDEAHALGVFGPQGRGCSRRPSDRTDPAAMPDLMTGTLGKALGSYGGFCACPSFLRDYLINCARTFIFSTALPPATVAAARASLRIIRRTPEGGPALLAQARGFHDRLAAAGLALPAFSSQIVPVMIGDNARTVAIAHALEANHIRVTGIRPPTVPQGTARIRLSVTSAHTAEDLDRAAAAIVGNAR